MYEWKYYGVYGIAVLFGFILRYFQERKKQRKVDFKFQIAASVIVSYVSWLVYRDRKITICSPDLWLFGWSYFGSVALSIFDQIFKEGFILFLKTIATKITYITEKEETKQRKNENHTK